MLQGRGKLFCALSPNVVAAEAHQTFHAHTTWNAKPVSDRRASIAARQALADGDVAS